MVLFFPFCISLDILAPNQLIKDGQSLISKEKKNHLRLFSPGNSSHRYLSIWYAKVKNQTVVWVANRNDPINDSSRVLSINQFGNLVLHDSSNCLVWSTNVSIKGTTITSSIAQLQDSANLVLVQDNNQKVLLWQSFDYPTDTLLPKMKLCVNLITGLDKFLTSWKSQDDPRSGVCFYNMIISGSPEGFVYKGSTPYWQLGPWPWRSSSPATATATATTSSGYTIDFVKNKDEVPYAYFLDDPYIISRLVVDNSGLLQQLMWNEANLQWKETSSVPKYRCDKYGQCGAYSKCKLENSNRFDCMCLLGYEPKSLRDWYLRDGFEGCVREKLGMSMCGNGEGFVKVQHLKGLDSANAAWMDMSMSSSSVSRHA
ncbi:G-type lectin S-receptor-like serine/threonine-protein kinase RKS1 [Quercus lobata]|uniref:G-type lectin S-receptor-like serine/threonine-protein kinase RKS1 n=1 Tax=Quercus lobata TaxID=97700 RepID=UPI001245988A|nr:G-type lectin S-receptor-like serine/threonine-protein kinase RKS1 [Quercus lobata]